MTIMKPPQLIPMMLIESTAELLADETEEESMDVLVGDADDVGLLITTLGSDVFFVGDIDEEIATKTASLMRRPSIPAVTAWKIEGTSNISA
jgi:hypothetical protein